MLGYDLSIPAVLLRRRALTATAPLEGDTLPADADIDWRLAIFATTAEGLAATEPGEIFLVPATGALRIWSNLDGTAEPIGQVARIEFGTVAALAAYDGPALPAGMSVRTRTEGFAYETLAAGVAADLIGANGTRWRILPDGDGVWDRQFFTIANDADRVNAAIQWTIDRQIAEGTVYKVKVRGLYTMDKPIRAFRFTGTAFQFVSVHLEAPAQGYVNNRRTQFRFTDGQNPGLVTQSIRQLTLRNIALVGAANPSFVSPSLEQLLARSGWWNPGGAVDANPQRQHTGILVDPFSASQPGVSRFPAFDGSGALPNHYVSGNGPGSTQITVSHCDLQGWITAMNCSGSAVQVGDSITVENCNISYNRNGIVVGESQNRGVHVNDCHSKYFDVFAGYGSGFGEGTGPGIFVYGGVYVLGYAMINGDHNRGNGAFTNVYAEGIWTLGHVTGTKGFQFNNCMMKFVGRHGNKGVSTVLSGAGPVTFNGGYYGCYIGKAYQLGFATDMTVTGGACFDAPPVIVNFSGARSLVWHDGVMRYGTGSGIPVSGRVNNTFGGWMGGARFALPGMPFVEEGTTGAWECLTPIQTLNLGNATVARAPDGTVTLTGLDVTNIFVDDTIVSFTSQNIPTHRGSEVGSAQFFIMGYVKTIDPTTGSCVLEGGSVDLIAGNTYAVGIRTFPTIRRPRQASLTSGSAVITGSGIVAGEWPVGTPIRGTGIPANTRVAAVAAGQITMTRAATATRTSDIADGVFMPVSVRRSVPPGGIPYPTGAFVWNAEPTRDASNMILTGWICTTGGTPGTWEPLYMSAVSPAT